MLLATDIREHLDLFKSRLTKRGYDTTQVQVLEQVIGLDDHRKSIQTEQDQLLAQMNILSKEIGSLFKSGNTAEAAAKKDEVAKLKENSKLLEQEGNDNKSRLEALLLSIPNIPHESVPPGNTEDDNEVYQDLKTSLPTLYDGAVPHWDLIEKYNIIDFKLGTKITGSGFPLYRGKGAKLQRALIQFFLDEASNAGYEEMIPPLLVNEETARATGQLPDKEGQMYFMERDNLYLIPTAEVPLTNVYRDEILREDQLPIKITGHTPCFRREAGSYGADVKGLNRVHQFDKIEVVQIVHPDKSYEVLMEMLDHVEGILKKLELPYRILRLCGGDLGFTSALTFDFEVYAAAQGRWLEVSSVSNFETFQTNRLKLRFKDADNKTRLCHTLNGSALALARIVAAILENNQTSDGVVVPTVLRPYTGFDIIN